MQVRCCPLPTPPPGCRSSGLPLFGATESQGSAGIGTPEGDEALRELRKVLAQDDEQVIQHALDAGIIDTLLSALQGMCVDSQLEAAWCITNLAAGSSAHTEAALATAPCLIQLLRSCSAAVQEQSVWALGNMAGDNPDFRLHLQLFV